MLQHGLLRAVLLILGVSHRLPLAESSESAESLSDFTGSGESTPLEDSLPLAPQLGGLSIASDPDSDSHHALPRAPDSDSDGHHAIPVASDSDSDSYYTIPIFRLQLAAYKRKRFVGILMGLGKMKGVLQRHLSVQEKATLAEEMMAFEDKGIGAALKRWYCYDLFGKDLGTGPCKLVEPNDLAIIINYCPNWGPARQTYLGIIETMLFDEPIVELAAKGIAPTVFGILVMPDEVQKQLVGIFGGAMMPTDLERWILATIREGGSGELFRMLLRNYKAHVPVVIADRFVPSVARKIFRLPMAELWTGDWGYCDSFLRFFREMVAECPNVLVGWNVGTISNRHGFFADVVANMGLLCIFSKDVPARAVDKIYAKKVEDTITVMDFYASITHFYPSRFPEERVYQKRRLLAMDAIGAIVEDSGLDEMMTPFEAALYMMLRSNAYSLMEMYLEYPKERQLGAEAVIRVLESSLAKPLAAAQLLTRVLRTPIKLKRSTPAVAAIVDIFNALSEGPMISPCHSAATVDRFRFPASMGQGSSQVADCLRAYLLLRFGIPLRETIIQGAVDARDRPIDMLSPDEYAGALNALIQRHCWLRYRREPTVTVKILYDGDENEISEDGGNLTDIKADKETNCTHPAQ